MAELSDVLLGEYVIEGQPTIGPAGREFRGRHARLDRQVRVLALDSRIADTPGFAERFSAALRASAALDHPHIVHIYDFFAQDGRYYIVSELVSGVSVATLLARRAQAGRLLPLAAALDIGRQAAEALAYAHGLGIAHGSLSAAHMHFERRAPQGEPAAAPLRIGGWELARLRGTPVSAPDDVEQLGAVLYQLCTGQVYDPASGAAPAPQAFRPGLSPAVASLITACLDPDPALRPSAAAVAEQLGRARETGRRAATLPSPGVELYVAPKRAAGATDATYQVTLRNSGNAPGHYTLGVAGYDDDLEIAFAQDEAVLDPGERAGTALIVRAPRRLVGSPAPRRFQVTAETDGRRAPPQAVEFVHQALLSPWLLLAAAALLLLIVLVGSGALSGEPETDDVAAAPTATAAPTDAPALAPPAAPTAAPTEEPTPTAAPGAPVVNWFAVEPQVAQPDGVVFVTWDVSGAERVTIDQFGDVPPSGRREHRPGQTTDYRLVAFGGGQETTRIERVSVVQPTPVPPTAELPTAVPPTAVPPTAEPPAEPTAELPGGNAPVFLIDIAPDARWVASGRRILFGASLPGRGEASAGYASDVVLEDNNIHPVALVLVPPAAPDEFIEGQFALPAIREGQHFLADIGFAQGVQDAGATVELRFGGEVIFRETAAVTGDLLRVQVDLRQFVGRTGRLYMRVSTSEGHAPAGVHWVNPRIDVMAPL